MPGQIERAAVIRRRRSPAVPPRCASSAASARSSPAASRMTPTSSHMISISRSRSALRSPGLAGERMQRARRLPPRARPRRARDGRHSPRSSCGMTSPAMPPNTVELATPLPPSRLAPCMPLASSPATNRPGQFRRGVGTADHAAHEVVRGRHHLDQAAGEIEAAVAAALDHALELLRDLGGAEMAHLDVDAAVRRGAPGPHLRIDRAADDVAGRAFERRIVVGHEAPHGAVEQIAAGAAQAFLQHGAGHAGVGPGEQAGRMELHHLHVAQRQAGAQAPSRGRPCSCRRRACGSGTWSGRRRSPAARPAPRRSAARRCGCRPSARRRSSAPSCAGISASARCSSSRRMPGRAHTCSISRLMISMPVRSPLCTVRSKVWPANALPCSVPSGLRSKKQPISFSSSRTRSIALGHQRPGEFLVRQPFAALDGVHEMALDRVARMQRDVVAALHHAGAAAFAEQALGGNRDVELGIGACACSAANRPAPPEPRIRMSVLSRSSAMRSIARSEHTRTRKTNGDDRGDRRGERRELLLAAAPRRSSRSAAGAGRPAYARSAGTPAASESFTSGVIAPAQEAVELRFAADGEPSARKCSGRKTASASPESRCTSAASHSASVRCASDAVIVMAAPPPRRRAGRAPTSSRPKRPPAMTLQSSAQRRPFDQNVAQPDRGMDGHRDDEQAVERRPNATLPRVRAKDVGRSQPVARRVEDHRDMHQHQRRHDGRGHPLPDVERGRSWLRSRP